MFTVVPWFDLAEAEGLMQERETDAFCTELEAQPKDNELASNQAAMDKEDVLDMTIMLGVACHGGPGAMVWQCRTGGWPDSSDVWLVSPKRWRPGVCARDGKEMLRHLATFG